MRYEIEYAREVHHRIELQEQELSDKKEAELAELRDALKNGFAQAGYQPGAKGFESLENEYMQLLPVVERQQETDLLSVAHIPALAEETYRQGLNVLMDALRLTQLIQSSSADRLKSEIAAMEREIETFRKEDQIARAEIREATVTSHSERVDLLEQQQLRVDELLYQANRCEASLARTRIELVALQAGSSGSSVSIVTESLQSTIHQTKEVQEELKRLGF